MLDAATACAIGSLWVGSQVERQATFPPPPATAALLAPRFNLLLGLGALLAALAALTWDAERFRRETSRKPQFGSVSIAPWLFRIPHSALRIC